MSFENGNISSIVPPTSSPMVVVGQIDQNRVLELPTIIVFSFVAAAACDYNRAFPKFNICISSIG